MCRASWNDSIYHQYILNVHPTATVLVNYMWDPPILSMHTSLHQLYCLLLSWWNILEAQRIWDCTNGSYSPNRGNTLKRNTEIGHMYNCYPQYVQKKVYFLLLKLLSYKRWKLLQWYPWWKIQHPLSFYSLAPVYFLLKFRDSAQNVTLSVLPN